MNEQLAAIIDLLKAAIEAGQTFTLSADDVKISTGPSGVEIEINNPTIGTES